MSINSKMTAIADAIRGKTGGTETMTLDAMAEAIASIQTGGGADELNEIMAKFASRTLTEVYFEGITIINMGRIFNAQTLLETIHLPNLEEITGWYTFEECHKLTSLVLPKLRTYGSNSGGVCKNCISLPMVDFPKLGKICGGDFAGCVALKVLVLRLDKVCTLANKNAFDGTPFASGGTGGTVYVPQALIAEYQQATNWSTLYSAGTCNFVAIEGSEYE